MLTNTFIIHPFHLHPEHQLSVAVLETQETSKRRQTSEPKKKEPAIINQAEFVPISTVELVPFKSAVLLSARFSSLT
jgi:hypothetical protein